MTWIKDINLLDMSLSTTDAEIPLHMKKIINTDESYPNSQQN